MSNVALYLNPEAFDTRSPALMGRQSAGESFLRGYLRHATADRFWFWNVANRKVEDLDALLADMAPVVKPVTHVPRTDRNALAHAGNVHLPSPNIAREAWHRNVAAGRKAYGISALTHTTASHDIMDAIANLLLAPIESWDTLICTSSAVRASVEVELEAVRADLENRLGATRLPDAQLVTIPLGINTDDFQVTEEHRTAWRTRLGIAPDAVVVLYVGRFNPHAKMNPVPMAMALERAAKMTNKPIAWVQAGWGSGGKAEQAYHDESRLFCPSVDYHVVDGRELDTRFTIWSVGDVFISLSDNVQETFGLTPVEAMAAGIPCVVSDWNGYRDTVRHGVDGFRAATYAPAAGTGNDIAYRHANDWIGYNAYVGGASQLTAVDLGDAARALADLIENPDLRRRMGDAARLRARSHFDWSGVVPQYEAMWDEMTARRVAAAPTPARARNLSANPRRLDPFHLFGGYATEWLTGSTMVMMTPGQGWGSVQALTRSTMAAFGGYALPTLKEFEQMVERLSTAPQMTVNDVVSIMPAGRRPFVGRGLLWLAKYDIITILPRAGHIPS